MLIYLSIDWLIELYFIEFVECTNKFVGFTNYLKNVLKLTKLARSVQVSNTC